MAAQWPPVVVKTYQARTLADATAQLQVEAQAAWADGYAVSSQTWAPGGRSIAGNICLVLGVLWVIGALALLLFIPIPALIQLGVAIFFVYAGAKSESQGTLAVTFARAR
jgi:hypothetical protein